MWQIKPNEAKPERVNEQDRILWTTPSPWPPYFCSFVCDLSQVISKPIGSGRQQETEVGKFRESETRRDFEDHSLLGPSQLVSQPAHIKCLLRFFVRACSNTCRYPYPSLYATLLYLTFWLYSSQPLPLNTCTALIYASARRSAHVLHSSFLQTSVSP